MTSCRRTPLLRAAIPVLLSTLAAAVTSGCGPEEALLDAESPAAGEAADLERAAPEPSEASTAAAWVECVTTTMTRDERACCRALDPALGALHPPCGSYVWTCRRFRAWGIYGDTFCAVCRDARGGSRESCLDKAACPEWAAWNDRGTLRCGTKPVVARVRDARGLAAALARAPECTRVEIDRGVERIDLTAVLAAGSLRLRRGVTLAGGPDGAPARPVLAMTRLIDGRAMLEADGDDVRVTGLHLQGPDPEIAGVGSTSTGVRAVGHDGLQVDHCELSGWPHAAVYLHRARYGFVHHDVIHHNRRDGLGYGVCLNASSSAIVEANRFDANRHAIAGTGYPDILYLARNNWVGPNVQENGQAFDMHGLYELKGHELKPWAGCHVEIDGNTIVGAREPLHGKTIPGVLIRGIPASSRGAEVHGNCFAHDTAEDAARPWLREDKGRVDWKAYRQKFRDLHWHLASDNRYGQPRGACPFDDR